MKNILILGAGFGGLHAGMMLGKKLKKGKLNDHKVILIDKNPYHTYTPTLYEISTTSKESANYEKLQRVNTMPVKELLGKLAVEFMQAEIVKIDLEDGDVHLSDGRKIDYDHLIIALGSETNFYDIPGLEKHALELKSFHDAVTIRDRVWGKVCTAKKGEEINIAIGGGGPTGVELAGELQAWFGQLKDEGYNCNTNAVVINASENVLNGFKPSIAKRATRRLEKMGTKIVRDRVVGVDANEVKLKEGGTVPYDVLVWTGGVRPNKLVEKLPIKITKNHIEVDQGMRCVPGESNLRVKGHVYAVGDNICIFNPKTGKKYPGVARAAIEQAGIVAKNIVRESENKKPVTYKPLNYPYIHPVGGKYAIAKFGPFVISGFIGWVLKGIVELTYLLSIMSIPKAIAKWIEGLRLFVKNDRLG